MIIVEAYKEYWKRAFDFKGKTKRNFFWWSNFAGFIVEVPVAIAMPESLNSLLVCVTLASLLASLSMSVRRLRDIGRSWQWLFLILIPPVFGPIILLTYFCLPSDTFNRDKPKQIISNQ